MQPIIRRVEVRWADLDPNFHVLHSKYYDYGAFCRMSVLVEAGITPGWMKEHRTGLILLREECAFRREIRFGDPVTVTCAISRHTPGFERFSMQHDIFRQEGELAARINAELAWMDLDLRKLSKPPEEMIASLSALPVTTDTNSNE